MKLRKQKCMGLALVAVSVLALFLASQGRTVKDRDATAVALFFPMGLYLIFTKEDLLNASPPRNEDNQPEPRSERRPAIQKRSFIIMARKRIVEAPALKSWAEVNAALREIAEAQIAIGDIESEMNKQILGAKKIAETTSKPYNDRISKLEQDIKEFTTDHRDDLGKLKSKTLTFGEVSFRLSTSISLPKAKEKYEAIIRSLKVRNMKDCIVVKEEISKENLKKYGEDTVNAVGATWKSKDVFGYEVFTDKIERPGAAED